ncbi:MAG: hypothetical protein RSD36_18720 [Terrisporobacter sp.]
MKCVRNSFLKDKELTNKNMKTVNKSIEDIISKISDFYIGTLEYELIKIIVHEIINTEINNLCELYERYEQKEKINAVMTLDENPYIEKYISNINNRTTEIMYVIPELLIDYIDRNN